MSQTAVAVIHSAAIQHNFRLLKEKAAGCKVMPVLKANAYGHGMVAVAKLLPEADAFAIARIDEGVKLRNAGIEQRLVVLGGCIDQVELVRAMEHGLDLVVHHAVQLELLNSYQGGRQVRVWVKVDTGMGRLGFDPAELPQVLQHLADCEAVTGQPVVMSHLACADEPDNDMTLRQIERFGHCLGESLINFGGDVSIANSAGILQWPEALQPSEKFHYTGDNWVRPGLALYGVSPVNGRTAADLGLQPAMTFRSRLITVKPIKTGDSVGYGADYVAAHDSVFGVAAVGYGDGYPRGIAEGTPVLVNDKRAAIIGRVSMDLIAIDLAGQPDAKPGDVVELWGEQLEVQEIAECAGTIAYELLTQLSRRPPRELD